MRLLYCYPYMGEMGWELANWVSHLTYVWETKGPFDRSVVWCRTGHEGLYRHLNVERFINVDEYEAKTEGNAFVLSCPDGYNAYKKHCVRADQHAASCKQKGFDPHVVRLPPSYYRYHRYKMRHRKFVSLEPTDGKLDEWSSRISDTAVIFHLRHIQRSKKKNTPQHLYSEVAKWARSNDRQFVTVGRTIGFDPKFKLAGLNLLNSTTLDDLIAIFHLGGLVVGSSSGPMHLAAMTGTPHVVWGGGRRDIRNRYLKEWNPFDTPVDHLTTAFNFHDNTRLVNALSQMSARAESRVKRRTSDVQAIY